MEASYGAVRLTELRRFADPAEAAATLALRDGRPEALGFYLDRRRVHVGDPTTTLDAVFHAWQTDRSQGLDPIMLAPTRELVRRLNQRAQDHRLAGAAPGRQVELADGNRASVDDLVITCRNDRRLHITATDWVKNGDRWTILNLTRTGGLTVRHVWNGRIVTLPAHPCPKVCGDRLRRHRAHRARVTADTMHGAVTGEQSRQQLYTMITRGRAANPLYVSVVGDGDPHAVIQPDSLHLRTATELLEQILERDASPHSATTLHREQHDPLPGSARPPHATSTPSTSPSNTSPTQVAASVDQSADHLLKGSQVSRCGRPCVATCCCLPPPAPIRSLNYSPPPQRGARPAPMIRPLSSDRGFTTSKRSPPGGRCPGCRAFPIASLATGVGDPTCVRDQTWSLSSQTKSASIPRVKRRPGRSSPIHLCRPS